MVKLSDIRALLKSAGIKTTEPIDRIDVKYFAGQPTGIDVMLTAGGITYIPIDGQ